MKIFTDCFAAAFTVFGTTTVRKPVSTTELASRARIFMGLPDVCVAKVTTREDYLVIEKLSRYSG
jgi:hypothetical protein